MLAEPAISIERLRSATLLPSSEIIGAIWEKALLRIPDLRFEKLGVFVGARSIAIRYCNQAGRLAIEMFEIGETGRVVQLPPTSARKLPSLTRRALERRRSRWQPPEE